MKKTLLVAAITALIVPLAACGGDEEGVLRLESSDVILSDHAVSGAPTVKAPKENFTIYDPGVRLYVGPGDVRLNEVIKADSASVDRYAADGSVEAGREQVEVVSAKKSDLLIARLSSPTSVEVSAVITNEDGVVTEGKLGQTDGDFDVLFSAPSGTKSVEIWITSHGVKQGYNVLEGTRIPDEKTAHFYDLTDPSGDSLVPSSWTVEASREPLFSTISATGETNSIESYFEVSSVDFFREGQGFVDGTSTSVWVEITSYLYAYEGEIVPVSKEIYFEQADGEEALVFSTKDPSATEVVAAKNVIASTLPDSPIRGRAAVTYELDGVERAYEYTFVISPQP